MAAIPNPLRGEVEAPIGDDLAVTLAIDMDGLGRLSAATGYPTLAELYRRLHGTEPMTVWLALDLFVLRGTLAGKALRKEEASAQARARLALDDLTALQGPLTELMACLMRKRPEAHPPGNGEGARNL